MATKGSAARPAASAETSNEVEKRLQALEAKTHTPCGGGSDSGRLDALEAKLNLLLERLKETPGVKGRLGDL